MVATTRLGCRSASILPPLVSPYSVVASFLLVILFAVVGVGADLSYIIAVVVAVLTRLVVRQFLVVLVPGTTTVLNER